MIQPLPRQEEAAASPETAATPSPTSGPAEDAYVEERERMVHYQIESRGVRDPEVLQAMRTVRRHEFVPDEYLHLAYGDRPLAIGYGQTISAPDIVAVMTELLELERGDKVLEIGTGSGYQAAILAQIIDEVHTVEIIPELAASARERLERLGYDNIRTSNHDGYYGWEEHAPYDRIIVTAAPDHVPQPIVEQLKDGGRLVIPVGPPGWYQTLWLITKENGEIQFHNIMGVGFVPLTGEH
ncbi:MAG: protein-L-isoaspartate O-methyltransferase [Chloroflexi bacterium B3_Chlor]|nr:MAG: protein-L-isoaspartate O-methyltransferase [Chloroflexi bacterium B3_Chlor]